MKGINFNHKAKTVAAVCGIHHKKAGKLTRELQEEINRQMRRELPVTHTIEWIYYLPNVLLIEKMYLMYLFIQAIEKNKK